MSTKQFLFAGFGGQGILFSGKFLAYKGLTDQMQVSWLPSYGPEMRGGTANCNVIISSDPVGSPIVSNPDILVAMNLPSLDKYEDTVVPGGMIFIDSTLIERKVKRTDVTVYYLPATKIASDNGFPTLANMVLMGKILSVLGQENDDTIAQALEKCVSARHRDLIEVNRTAMKIGMEYKEEA